MGKFGIGARVRDWDGDEATIIGKPSKGIRTIKYDKTFLSQSLLVRKSRLTAIESTAKVEAAPVDTIPAPAEQWVPKVGDRVRYGGDFSPWLAGKLGVVKRIDFVDNVVVDWDDAPQGSGVYPHNLEPVASELEPATPEPAPLTIEAGKFYRTRDGRKVGPMEKNNGLYDQAYTFMMRGRGFGPAAWMNTGKYWKDGQTDPRDLIAEWVDDPVVAVEAVEPAPAKRKFKVGDVVNYVYDGERQSSWQGVIIERDDGTLYHAKDDRLGGGAFYESWLELATTTTPTTTTTPSFIVARLTPAGKPLPNSKPVVHTSRDTADTEAQRLADKYGADFAVYERVSVRELDVGPVPKTFVLSRAKAALTEPSKLSWAFVWSDTKWGQEFWEAQADSALTPLGRAILAKWIAQAGAAAQPATPANDDAPASIAA